MKDPVYLDYAATAPLLPDVKTKMQQVMKLDLGNAAALHSLGQLAKSLLDEARENIAQLLGCDMDEIIFTSGGTEANNTVMEIFHGQKVLISSVEHPSVREAAKARASKVIEVGVDHSGRILLEDLEKKLDEETGLVSVMLANNELGTIEPIKDIVECCKKYNIPVHCDATQAFSKIKTNVRELGVDYLTISAHKIGGPTGIGALFVRKGARYQPLLYGGHQENKRRAGTSNTLNVAGFGAAAKWCWDNWSCQKWSEVAKLRDMLRKRILHEVPYSSCNSPEENCLPNMLNMSFQAAEGESIQLYLDLEGITVSTGSACASGDIKPSHTLMAITGNAEVAHNSIRFSLGLDTTQNDIERLMAVLPGIVRRLQGISTVKIKEQSE